MEFNLNMTERLCYNLGLSYTLTCNARCAHCSVWSSPELKGKLGLDKAIECIKEAAEFGIHIVALTGGEPTVFLNDLFTIMEVGYNHYGTKFAITTNAYWARTPEKAREIVQHMADNGLIHLRMSADRYHQEYIPLERVIWAVEAGVAYDVPTRVDIVMRRRDPKSVKIWSLFKKYPIEVGIQALAPKGRALENYSQNDFPTTSLQAIRLGSCRQAGEVMVHHNGYVSICCNFDRVVMATPEMLAESPYILGNVYEEPLSCILERNEHNPISRLIRYEGPYGIYKLLMYYFKEELDILLRPRYGNPCILCDELMCSSRLIPYIKRAGELFARDYERGLIPLAHPDTLQFKIHYGGGI